MSTLLPRASLPLMLGLLTVALLGVGGGGRPAWGPHPAAAQESPLGR
jgi:hypothetical protein